MNQKPNRQTDPDLQPSQSGRKSHRWPLTPDIVNQNTGNILYNHGVS